MGQRLAEPEAPAKPANASVALAVLLTLMLAVHSTSVDAIFPAIPELRAEFGLSPGAAQLAVGAFIYVYGVSQLLFGPLADRIGRRPVVLGAMAVYGLAGIAATLAPSFVALVAARVFQGIGAAAGPPLARTVVRDVYGPTRSAAVLGYLMSAFGVLAVLTPIAGGLLTVHFGWRAVFGFTAVYAFAIVAIAAAALPETRPEAASGAPRPRLLAGFAGFLRDRRFVVFAGCNCLTYGAMFAWISGGVFVLIEVVGLSADAAGAYFALSIVGFILTSVFAGRMAARFGSARTIAIGTVICLLAALALFAGAVTGRVGIATLVGPAFVFLVGIGFVNPIAIAAAIAPYPMLAGSASSLIGFLQTVAAATSIVATGYLYDGTAAPMALVMVGLSTLALAALLPLAAARKSAG
jgi:DHA1 family bicyclomycin/chloramphenicol resistance-like MFS transporter